jgi:hypothetical protein
VYFLWGREVHLKKKKKPARTDQLDQDFPWFSTVLEKLLSSCQIFILHCSVTTLTSKLLPEIALPMLNESFAPIQPFQFTMKINSCRSQSSLSSNFSSSHKIDHFLSLYPIRIPTLCLLSNVPLSLPGNRESRNRLSASPSGAVSQRPAMCCSLCPLSYGDEVCFLWGRNWIFKL